MMEENITIPKLVLEAIKFACASHALQRYGEDNYYVHLQDVDDILCEFGFTEAKYRCGGWLHDIIEGTDYSYNNIKKIFGRDVAEIVYLCSDFKGRNRKERKPAPFYEELKENKDAIVIKVADRLANIRRSIKTGHGMSTAYQEEHEKFKSFLYFEGHIDKMWEEIDILLSFLSK